MISFKCGKAVVVARGKILRIVMLAKLIIATRKNVFINIVWMEYTIILIKELNLRLVKINTKIIVIRRLSKTIKVF